MRIVLDTNVLVSSLLSPFSPPAQMVRMVTSGVLTLCLDARLLTEYDEVLGREKFQFDPDAVAALLDYVVFPGHTVASSPLPAPLPDPKDEAFLEIALAGGAEYLVTGNGAHFPETLCEGVRVVSPAGFLAAWRQRGAT
jgi:putative PIN family toxin of toxin-antitoxin system